MISKFGASAAALAAVLVSQEAAAQIMRSPILDAGSVSAIRGEVETRYDAALALTGDRAVVRANDSRYIHASEAKAACGIARGYLKTGAVHEESINKCDDFARRMTMVSAPPAEPAAPAQAPSCDISLPVQIFFDFDVDVPPAEANETVQKVAGAMQLCGWSGLVVAGHTDRSGSDAYNLALSERRARNTARLFEAAGLPAASLRVEANGEQSLAVDTQDGVREPQNRRVTISAASQQ